MCINKEHVQLFVIRLTSCSAPSSAVQKPTSFSFLKTQPIRQGQRPETEPVVRQIHFIYLKNKSCFNILRQKVLRFPLKLFVLCETSHKNRSTIFWIKKKCNCTQQNIPFIANWTPLTPQTYTQVLQFTYRYEKTKETGLQLCHLSPAGSPCRPLGVVQQHQQGSWGRGTCSRPVTRAHDAGMFSRTSYSRFTPSTPHIILYSFLKCCCKRVFCSETLWRAPWRSRRTVSLRTFKNRTTAPKHLQSINKHTVSSCPHHNPHPTNPQTWNEPKKLSGSPALRRVRS